jgi:hypothetical protein
MKILEVRKIWDKAPHNALTDLIRFEGWWYCAFREGESHVSYDGRIRVIRSEDGEQWSSVALLEWMEGDLRDPKFSVSPSGELMLNGAVRFPTPVDGNTLQSVTWFSRDGENWSQPFASPDGRGTWRWSVTWHKGVAYSFGYGGKDQAGCLYRSTDGKTWEVLKEKVYPDARSFGNETSLVFLDNDDAYCLLRRDKGSCSALLGVAHPPYTQWTWSDLARRIGGPKMIAFDKDCFLAAVRLYEGEEHTSLCWIEPRKGQLTESLELPSGGDTSYAGLVFKDGLLWISYYSSHEDRTAVYLAKVSLAPRQHPGLL